MDIADEKDKINFRRLLLAKQLYKHAYEHSYQGGPLNKMIAVHNFHNAIEIALRAILLHYDIRREKQLNIEFEVMLNEIDTYDEFVTKKQRLPYRRELRTLNQLRNLVQHQAVEPETSTMEDWRVFTHRFLQRICEEYFGLDFSSLSSLEMIEDVDLRELLRLALSSIHVDKFGKSVALAKLAFVRASESFFSFLPEQNLWVDADPYTRELGKIFQHLEQRSHEAMILSGLLASGISLADYQKFQLNTPNISYDSTGRPRVYENQPRIAGDKETARWICDFVVNSIVHWQAVGLNPHIVDKGWLREKVKEVIATNGASLEIDKEQSR